MNINIIIIEHIQLYSIRGNKSEILSNTMQSLLQKDMFLHLGKIGILMVEVFPSFQGKTFQYKL